MKRTGKCPKCESTDIIADAAVLDRGQGSPGELTVATYKKPDAILFRGQQETTVSAWVCAGCGFTEFYADIPGLIRRPVEKKPKR